MKKLNVFVLATLVAAGSVFTGCTEEETNPAPQITFANNVTEVTLAAGETSYQINADITTEVGLKDVKLFKVTAGGEDQIGTAITSFDDRNNYALRASVSNITTETVVKVQATDRDNQSSSRNFTIKVTGGPVGELQTWSGKILGAQKSTTGSSFASSDGSVYNLAGAASNSAKIDFVYFYGATNKATLAAPADADAAAVYAIIGRPAEWPTRNATKIAKGSAADYDNATVASLTALSIAGTKANDLKVNDVVVFETVAGKKGVLKVTGISTNADTGNLTFTAKMTK
jgi:hypothetical protein